MIELLIKMADSLDTRGFYKEASKIDALIKKIATSLEYDNGLVKKCSDCASHADDMDDADDYLMDDVEDFASYTDDYNEINDAYDKVIRKRRKKTKG